MPVLSRILVALFLSAPLFAQSSFPLTVVPAGAACENVATPDLDGDGRRDFVAVSTLLSQARIHLQDASGGFTLAAIAATGAAPRDAMAVDHDGDGDDDLITVSNSNVTVFTNNTFNLVGVTIPIPTTSSPAHVGDVAGSLLPDIRFESGMVMVNLGGGNFAAPAALTSPGQLADLEGDGDLDVFSHTSTTVAVRRNNGGGSFTTLPGFSLPAIPGATVIDIHFGDTNGDGAADLAVSYETGAVHFWSFSVFLGTGTGSFSLASQTYVGGEYETVRDVAFEDIDGDGLSDITYVCSLPGGLVPQGRIDALVYYARPQGGYLSLPPTSFPSIFGAPGHAATRITLNVWPTYDVDVVDMDADGLPDFATTGWSTSSLGSSVFYNRIDRIINYVSGPTSTATLQALGPIVIALTDRNGAPVPNEVISVQTSYPLSGPSSLTTDFMGRATYTSSPPTAAATTLLAFQHNAAAPMALEITITNSLSLSVVSGDGQSVYPGMSYAPLVVELTNTQTGLPVAGVDILFTNTVPPGLNSDNTLVGPTLVPTDAAGRAGIDVIAGTQPTSVVNASVASIGSVGTMFNLLTQPFDRTVTVLSGDDQVTRPGEPFGQPVVAEIRDVSSGMLLANTQFDITTTSGSVSPSTVVSDSLGRITFTATAGPAAGPMGIDVFGADPATERIDFYVRKLTVTWNPGSEILATIITSNVPLLPLLLAADMPLPPPGHINSPYGQIHTSVVSPGPGLRVLDGIGIYGPPDPSVLANPNFVRIFQLLGNPLAGMTLVFEAYLVDLSLSFPQNIFITNPVTVTF